MQFDQWVDLWDRNSIGFHRSEIHPDLIAHEKLFPKGECRVYIPLCGKSLDLVYLADKGYDVHGCEFVEKAVKDFFIEQNLEYTVKNDSKTGIAVYTAVSKQITLYQGDFFVLTSKVIGKFNAIWDRASVVAIEPSRKQEYAKVMLDIMAPNCKYLLHTFVFGRRDYDGPPYSVTEEDVNEMYEEFCDIQLLDTVQPESLYVSVQLLDMSNRILSLKQPSVSPQ